MSARTGVVPTAPMLPATVVMTTVVLVVMGAACRPERSPRHHAVATAVCGQCSVQWECADDAARTPVHGVWGAKWRGRRVRPRAA